jgi:hypothetical protein
MNNRVFALIILVLVIFIPVTAFAQNQNQSLTERESMANLLTEGIIESDKATSHIDKMTDIHESCRDRAIQRDLSIIPACVEITKEYNQAMTKLFSDHRELVKEILNE